MTSGRTIHINLDIKLTPREKEAVGSTDGGMELAKSIVDDIAALLHIVATNEGFVVDVSRRNTVY